MNILFDAMGAQIQVQEATGNRLTRWFRSLTDEGIGHGISNYTQPISSQLDGVNVYVSLTRQLANPTNLPAGTCFTYLPQDLGYLQTWVHGGGSILLFTNHSQAMGTPGGGPTWPIFEIQLAASLGIQLVFAAFAPTEYCKEADVPCPRHPRLRLLEMVPAAHAPRELVHKVSAVQAWDSGGIVTGSGTALIDLPHERHCRDVSGLHYTAQTCCFGALYRFGKGKVIILGHSGITADHDTCNPSPGQIDYADNLTFLNNCVRFLAG